MIDSRKKPLILVSGQFPDLRYYQQDRQNHSVPRLDYIEIAQRIDGEIIGDDLFDSKISQYFLRLEKRMKVDIFESLISARQIKNHNLILSTSEKGGLPLSLIMASTRNTIPHIVISHHISSQNKDRFFRFWPLYRSISHWIFVSQSQARYAVDNLGIPEKQVTFVYDNVDHRFFSPREHLDDGYVLAVGNEQRDYQCLVNALSGLGIKLVIVASSPWSNFRYQGEARTDIKILKRISYHALRDLYSRARVVVLPLVEVDYAAGVNAALEAMSMGKPLIVSQTRGIAGYIEHGQSGVLVPPGDSDRLREEILALWNDQSKRERLGANARRVVVERMNLENYVARVSDIANGQLVNPGGENHQA